MHNYHLQGPCFPEYYSRGQNRATKLMSGALWIWSAVNRIVVSCLYYMLLSGCCQPRDISVLYLYNTEQMLVLHQHLTNLDAGDRFELPMQLAYETAVVATLPA